MGAKLGNMLLSVIVCALLWGGGELVASVLLSARGTPFVPLTEDSGLYAVEAHSDYGYALTPAIEHEAHKLTSDGRTCYRVRYRSDLEGRRLVGASDPSLPHLLLFGDSNTFGEGLNDSDTLQAHLAEQREDMQTYNYALHGYGPSHALARLQSGEVRRHMQTKHGAAVYVMIPEHISRTIGDSRAHWIYDSPYYFLAEDATLQRSGSFRSGRAFKTSLLVGWVKIKQRSALLTLLNLNFPGSYRPHDAALTAEVLAAARATYRRQFEGEFYVVFHPSWSLEQPTKRATYDVLRKELARRHVPLLDYAGSGTAPELVIDSSCDLHANGLANKLLAQRLASDLPPLQVADVQPVAGAAQ